MKRFITFCPLSLNCHSSRYKWIISFKICCWSQLMYLFSYLLCRFSGLVLAIINCNSVNIVNSCKNVVIWGFAISIYCKYLYNLMENMGIHLHAIHANKFFSCFMICLICVKWQHSDGLGITTIYFSGLRTRWTSSCHQGDVLFFQNDKLQFLVEMLCFDQQW